MPQKRADDRVIIHAPQWAPDETVTLRPAKGWGAVMHSMTSAVVIPPGVDRTTLTQEQVAAYTDPTAGQIDLMERMIVSWTLRYEPTAEQTARGEAGDPLPPPTRALIEALDAESGAFIALAIEELGQDQKPEGVTPASFPGGVAGPGPGADAPPTLG